MSAIKVGDRVRVNNTRTATLDGREGLVVSKDKCWCGVEIDGHKMEIRESFLELVEPEPSPTFGVGDTVSLTGTVLSTTHVPGYVAVQLDAGHVIMRADRLTLVEKAKAPVYANSATESRPGDRVHTQDGRVFMRDASRGDWWDSEAGHYIGTPPLGTLTLVERDGRVFTGDQ